MSIIVLFRLFPDRPLQKLIVFGVRIIFGAFRKQRRGIIDDLLQSFRLRDVLIMVYDAVSVIRICVMLQPLKQFDLSVPVKFFYKVGDAGIQQFQAAHLSDVGLDHHAVHPFDGRR